MPCSNKKKIESDITLYMKNIHIAIRVSFFLLPALIVCSLLYFFDLFLFTSISSQKDKVLVEDENSNRKSLKKVLKPQKISNIYGFSDWCQLNYEDLSEDPIFDQFEYWIKQHDSLQVEGDQREFFSTGQELAKKRSKVLQKIIRGDPKTALKLAIQSKQIEKFPPSVKEHLENWRSNTADIESTHVCFDPKHPGVTSTDTPFLKTALGLEHGFLAREEIFPQSNHFRYGEFPSETILPFLMKRFRI